ncbi:L-cysteate sulfo-lyase [Sinobacterium norvegicum]|uniref:L-cysteate sulfo-lyase n=1 Tax=Sinobacterium norvegicum TaxID=1641715 RepID=A0ABN8ECH8_9GAMM|nr:D-cysteine desulfhydrase family protein [Sinobacterium norvegicum]CAH0990198.1 L-cysteate sulfo-lyase [Sinobacterium norvegicum]
MDTINYPARLPLAQESTPLQYLKHCSEQSDGPRIWVKRDDLTGSVLSGNKVRKLSFSLAEALAQGCDTVITCGGVQSNHCRATAIACAQLGLRCHLILRGEESGVADGNVLLGQLAGASISYYPAKVYFSQLEQLFADWQHHYAEQGGKAFAIPTGASDGIGIWGYIQCAEELASDFAAHQIEPGHILCASGSGGTQAGLTVGAELFNLNALVHGVNVCDDAAWFNRKVADDIAEWLSHYPQASAYQGPPQVSTIDGYVGPGYAKATSAVYATIQSAARLDGLILDPVYTGKAFMGMLAERNQGRFNDSEDIVFIHTGGVFGLYPYKEQLFDDK